MEKKNRSSGLSGQPLTPKWIGSLAVIMFLILLIPALANILGTRITNIYNVTDPGCTDNIFLSGNTPMDQKGTGGIPISGTPGQDIGSFVNPLVKSDVALCFAVGQYTFSSTFLLAGNQHDISIIGHSSSGILGYGPDLGSDGTNFILACSSNKDLLQVGDNTNQAPGGYSIANVIIKDITFEGQKSCNTSGDCIHGISWSGGGIEGSTLHNCAGNGIQLAVSSLGGVAAGCCLIIRSNTIEFIMLDGISENGQVYDFIYANHFEQTGHSCINLISKRQNVGNNNFLQCGWNTGPGTEYPGVFIQGQYNDVHNNYFENIEFDCIKINGQSNTISNNRIDHCGACNFGGCGFNYSGIKVKYQNNTIVGNVILDDYPNRTTVAGIQENTAGGTKNIITSNIVQNCLHTCSISWLTTSTAVSTWFSNNPLPAVSSLSQASPYTNVDPFTEILIVTVINGSTALICNGVAMGTPTLGMSCTLRTGQVISWSTANPTFSKVPQ